MIPLKFHQKSRAFTFVELLVAIAVLTVLVAILVPAISAIRKRTQASQCVENLRQIGIGVNLYLADHEQRMPILPSSQTKAAHSPGIDRNFAPYLGKSETALSCPADPDFAKHTGSNYLWNTELSGQLFASLSFLNHMIENKHDIPVVSDKGDWHLSGKNFLYADGTVGNHPLSLSGK